MDFSAKRIVAVYLIIIGAFMIVFWSFLILADQVPSEQKPYAIGFHLVGEFLTAILLMISGVASWMKKRFSKFLSPLALGMLLYTVIVSPGYYAQMGETVMVAMFMIMVALTVVAIIVQKR